jgi:cytochrome b involved in lipid metabolism
MSKVYTIQDIADKKTSSDLWMAVHGKVYNITEFIDEHPGGEEILLECGGEDATEAFEDIGHSDSARETLEKYLVGTLDNASALKDKEEKKAAAAASTKSEPTESSIAPPIIAFVVAALGFFVYKKFLSA